MTAQAGAVVRTVRLKVKPDAAPWLSAAAVEVNQVWNWANETSAKAARPFAGRPRYLSGYDLMALAAGAYAFFGHIRANSINSVCAEYARKRLKARASKLRWRRSGGTRRSLGWVPVRALDIKRKGKALRYYGKTIRVFELHRLEGVNWRGGCFAQDAVGDWWLCLTVKVEATNQPAPLEAVGIDLGLKDTATTSDGERLAAGRHFRSTERRIAQAQRRGHRRQARRLHRKVARQRQDALHKFTAGIVARYQYIAVGDVSTIRMAQGHMAKAVYDSGWGMLKTQLHYKGQQAGRSVEVVNERNTTRACSNCGQFTGPSGLRQLVVREWTCVGCGAAHDRDVNAARNILRLRQQPPSAGTRLALPATAIGTHQGVPAASTLTPEQPR